MSFLCVMNYELGRRCTEMFSDMEREFYREGEFHTYEIMDYQDAVHFAYSECANNDVSNSQLTLRHVWLDWKHFAAIRTLLQNSVSKLKTCDINCSEEFTVNTCMKGMEQVETLRISSAIEDDPYPQNIPTTCLNKLTFICLNNVCIQNDDLNLASCENLKVLIAQNLTLKHLTINSAKLEEFWVSIKNNMPEKTPPMEVAFANGRPFTNKIRELSLDNATFNETLNIQQCDKLQELHLDTFSFPDDFHLNLSSFTYLIKITLRNLSLRHVTIAPAKLEQFWVINETHQVEKESPLEVIFAIGEQFTNKLRTLSLDNVSLNETLNIQQCDKLQQLELAALTFPDGFHLDLSYLMDLTVIILNDLHLQHLTIAPAQLEEFWVSFTDDLEEKTPTMELTLAHGEQFSNKLRELSMDKIVLNETLNIHKCDKLHKLRLDTLSFPDGFHMDLSSFMKLTAVILKNLSLQHVTIDPFRLERLWVSIKNDQGKNTPPIEMTFANGQQFTNSLRKLNLYNVTLNETLNIQQCDKLQQLRLDTISFPDGFHLELSSFVDLTVVILKNLRLQHVTINPFLLERFCVSIKEDMRERTPPLGVTFKGLKQFTDKLRELSLDNVALDETLNLQQCDKLRKLELNTLTFPDGFRLDLSSSTELTDIKLQNLRLKHVTIAPTKLEIFWVAIKEHMLGNTPPMEVTFAHGQHFTNKLRELGLMNVTLIETLNIQQCDKLQKMQLDTLTFSDDFRLDLSFTTDLTMVILNNLRLKHVKIAPAQLEQFWVTIKNDLRDKTPPMEVTFAHGEQFSNKLRKLSLENVALNETLNIQECDKLLTTGLPLLSGPH